MLGWGWGRKIDTEEGTPSLGGEFIGDGYVGLVVGHSYVCVLTFFILSQFFFLFPLLLPLLVHRYICKVKMAIEHRRCS